MELGSYFLFLQEHIKDIIISRMTAVIVLYTHTHTLVLAHTFTVVHTRILKWGTLGRAQGRRSAARLNDVLGEEPFGPQPII